MKQKSGVISKSLDTMHVCDCTSFIYLCFSTLIHIPSTGDAVRTPSNCHHLSLLSHVPCYTTIPFVDFLTISFNGGFNPLSCVPDFLNMFHSSFYHFPPKSPTVTLNRSIAFHLHNNFTTACRPSH